MPVLVRYLVTSSVVRVTTSSKSASLPKCFDIETRHDAVSIIAFAISTSRCDVILLKAYAESIVPNAFRMLASVKISCTSIHAKSDPFSRALTTSSHRDNRAKNSSKYSTRVVFSGIPRDCSFLQHKNFKNFANTLVVVIQKMNCLSKQACAE